ncbi:MAG: hypothetical protein E6G14_13645 [Actinobacteria bacterium]|nr:MAG: hypothetical protein E6G14_13645 [Actinomycetota bacterium]
MPYFAPVVGAGLHRDWNVYFSDPVPDGGMTVNLASSDTSKLTVPASISVAAGATFAEFPVSGISPTAVSATITASATGWLSGTRNVDVVTPTFSFPPYMPTSRTTLSAPHLISVGAFLPSCFGYCTDVANNDITVQFAVTGAPAGIVSVTPASVTLHQNAAFSDPASVGTPTRAGSYTITASANGFDPLTSDPVTVTQPAFTIIAVPYFAPVVGLTVNFSSSDPTIATVLGSVTVLAGAISASVPVSGVAVGVVEITASAIGWTGDVEQVSAETATFSFYPYPVQTSRTTSSAPEPISVIAFLPSCFGYCTDVANNDITVQFAVTGAPAGIVSVTPASVILHQNTAISDIANVGTPTAAGTYTITVSATGFTDLRSDLVTVSP